MQIAFVTLASTDPGPNPKTFASAWKALWPNEDGLELADAEGTTMVFPFMDSGNATISHELSLGTTGSRAPPRAIKHFLRLLCHRQPGRCQHNFANARSHNAYPQ